MGAIAGRRRFLTRTAAWLAATGVGRISMGQTDVVVEPRAKLEGDRRMIPIIDTHQHLWDLTIFRLPWQKDNPKLARSFVMRDYLEATAGLNVVKSIYMEVDVEPSQQPAEADHVIEICRRGDTPMAAAVISGRPASDGFAGYIARYKDSPYIKGVRQVLHGAETPPGYCLDEHFLRGIRLLGTLGLSFDICIRSAELRDAAKLIDACPDTRFILDHCGNASVRADDLSGWRADIEQVARRPNVVCKVSGIVASAAPDPWTADDLAPIVNHVLDTFGPDRVMFGGDWPVCTLAATYREWVEALKKIVADRSEQDQRKLFHDNAFQFYRLG
jgi:predicted TIM-barrel fold metal-dependent hydrolase